MERKEFVAKVAELLGTKQDLAEIAINATITEMMAPRIWGNPGESVGILDNACNNNCKDEIGRLAPSTSVLTRK